MKILITKRPKQFEMVQIVCADRIMVLILKLLGVDVDSVSKIRSDFSAMNRFALLLKSGAKLRIGEKRDTWSIYGYHYSGQDIIDACKQLLTLEAEVKLKSSIHELELRTAHVPYPIYPHQAAVVESLRKSKSVVVDFLTNKS